MDYKALLRRKIANDMYSRMSEEDKRLYCQMRDHDEVMQKLDEIGKKKYSWLSDFGANIAGNAAWDTFVYLGSKILKRL